MIKKVTIVFISLLLIFSFKNDSSSNFESGEFLKFKIFYNLFPFTAGYATLNLQDVNFNGVPHYYIKGEGKTVGIYRIFPVDDLYATYINKSNSLPTKFIRKIDEGGYKKDLVQYFYRNTNQVKVVDNIKNTEKMYASKQGIQDMLSAFYYLRTVDFSDKKTGDYVSIDIFMDEEIYPFKMKILGRETKKTKFGKTKCLILRPYVQAGRVFKEKESVTFWVTDDENKIPVAIKAELAVGSLKAELIEYKNLKHKTEFK
ncbi:MAG: DUF3108 domain-containing protein [Flavobacteriales bacterium]|nr:DUF3108 domain-containing protein [Flavobacteriales bacterium]